MAGPHDQEPPGRVTYDLEKALSLLADLEDARDALIEFGHLTVVVSVASCARMMIAFTPLVMRASTSASCFSLEPWASAEM